MCNLNNIFLNCNIFLFVLTIRDRLTAAVPSRDASHAIVRALTFTQKLRKFVFAKFSHFNGNLWQSIHIRAAKDCANFTINVLQKDIVEISRIYLAHTHKANIGHDGCPPLRWTRLREETWNFLSMRSKHKYLQKYTYIRPSYIFKVRKFECGCDGFCARKKMHRQKQQIFVDSKSPAEKNRR